MRLDLSKPGAPAALEKGRSLDQMVPCRKCAACRRAKSFHWAKRCVGEWLQSHRTWFGTLTFNAAERFRVRSFLRQQFADRGQEFDALPSGEQFEAMANELWPRVMAFIKRLRKRRVDRPAIALRYFASIEPHRDGFPHFHILLHEDREYRGFGERQLRAEWRDAQEGVKLGHAEFTLVRTAERARYAAKYVGKLDLGRVRASQRYGKRDDVPIRTASALGGLVLPAAAFAEDGGEVSPGALGTSKGDPPDSGTVEGPRSAAESARRATTPDVGGGGDYGLSHSPKDVREHRPPNPKGMGTALKAGTRETSAGPARHGTRWLSDREVPRAQPSPPDGACAARPRAGPAVGCDQPGRPRPDLPMVRDGAGDTS